jgi:ribose-phosphate pyrophosphokinase
MKIIPGPASKQLGEELAELLNVEAVPLVYKTYPDGESYVRIEGTVKNEKVVIVQTTSPPQDTRLVQLVLIADAAKRHGAKKTTVVVPYLAYARQDKVFLPGEALSIEAVARMLKAVGVDSLTTVNIHEEKVLAKFPFPARTVSAIPLLAEYFKQKGFDQAFALAPDDGALWLAEEAKTVLGGECGYLEKHRDLHTGQVKVEKKQLDVDGKTVIIFDDVISTGGTVASAAKIMKELGAERVYAACVHPLLIGDAEKSILEAGVEEIVGTDSVPSRVSKVSVAPLLSRILT